MLYPKALQTPGPAWKTGYGELQVRRGRGAVVHSAEGYLPGALKVLNGQARTSWHFTVDKDGSVLQHYPLDAITWHAGERANHLYVGIECIGVAGEPLTPAQLAALVELVNWIAAVDQWPGMFRGVTLFEHNEFMATACPSGRIPWNALTSHTAAPSPGAQLRGLIAAAFVISIGNPLSDLSPEDQAAVRYVATQLTKGD